MAGLTPTQRTLKALRNEGRICAICEKFNPHVGQCGIRQDLFGFIDIIALNPDRGIVAIQSTGSDFAGHVKKLTEERNEAVYEWIRSGGRVELWGWRKIKLKRGSVALRWKPRIADIVIDNEEIVVKERK